MRRLAAASLALGFAVLACQIVAGIERVDKVPPTPEAQAPEAEPPPPDPCQHALPPTRPARSDAAPEDRELPAFYLATRSLALVPAPGTPAPGFDLDGVCTCEKEKPTPGDGGSTCRASPKTVTCDGDGGIDNQAARMFDEYRAIIEIDQAANINDEIENGYKTLLLQISGYNGLPNDSNVKIGVFPSEGIYEPAPANAQCDASTVNPRADFPDGGVWRPTWCGEDRWSVVAESAFGIRRPLVGVRTGSGWVRDGVLVVEVNDSLQVPFLNSVLSLVTARIVGRLVPLGANRLPRDASAPPAAGTVEERFFELRDGVIAGRVSARDLLVAAGSVDDPFNKDAGRHLCTSPLFDNARDVFCGYLDIASNPERDLDLAYPCDALSSAFGFAAFPAVDGDLMNRQPIQNECALGANDRPIDAGRNVVYACPLAEAGR